MGSRKVTNGTSRNRAAKAENGTESGATTVAGTSTHPAARSLAISSKGVQSGQDFANLMSALMSDVIEGRINPVTANAAVNAGGKLLKVVEMQYRYGQGKPEEKRPDFMLAAPSED